MPKQVILATNLDMRRQVSHDLTAAIPMDSPYCSCKANLATAGQAIPLRWQGIPSRTKETWTEQVMTCLVTV